MNISLLSGWLPWVLVAAALVVFAGLLLWPPSRLRPPWRWWLRAMPALVGCGALVLLLDYLIRSVWRLFPDVLPPMVLLWSWLALGAVVLAVLRLPYQRWRGWLLAPLALLLVLAGATAAVNSHYGYYRTLGAALGTGPKVTNVQLGEFVAETVAAPAGGYLADVWEPPAGLPAHGTLSEIDIPGTASGFTPRQEYLYLPPAYAVTPRPLLPVLVLLHGSPGNPGQWVTAGGIVEMLDAFAAAHRGLAPIVVLPDAIGSDFGDPGCKDGPDGNIGTYLTQDVPTWIQANVQTATGPSSWAVAGFSYGGTCALQLSVAAPDVYGRFISVSGEREPESARLLAQQRFEHTAARLVMGADDQPLLPEFHQLASECEAAGMNVSKLEIPGGHTMEVWRSGVEQSLPWLAAHTALTPP